MPRGELLQQEVEILLALGAGVLTRDLRGGSGDGFDACRGGHRAGHRAECKDRRRTCHQERVHDDAA